VSETWGEGHKIQELEVKVMDLRDLGVSVMWVRDLGWGLWDKGASQWALTCLNVRQKGIWKDLQRHRAWQPGTVFSNPRPGQKPSQVITLAWLMAWGQKPCTSLPLIITSHHNTVPTWSFWMGVWHVKALSKMLFWTHDLYLVKSVISNLLQRYCRSFQEITIRKKLSFGFCVSVTMSGTFLDSHFMPCDFRKILKNFGKLLGRLKPVMFELIKLVQ
jgi:hypothetical protein